MKPQSNNHARMRTHRVKRGESHMTQSNLVKYLVLMYAVLTSSCGEKVIKGKPTQTAAVALPGASGPANGEAVGKKVEDVLANPGSGSNQVGPVVAAAGTKTNAQKAMDAVMGSVVVGGGMGSTAGGIGTSLNQPATPWVTSGTLSGTAGGMTPSGPTWSGSGTFTIANPLLYPGKTWTVTGTSTVSVSTTNIYNWQFTGYFTGPQPLTNLTGAGWSIYSAIEPNSFKLTSILSGSFTTSSGGGSPSALPPTLDIALKVLNPIAPNTGGTTTNTVSTVTTTGGFPMPVYTTGPDPYPSLPPTKTSGGTTSGTTGGVATTTSGVVTGTSGGATSNSSGYPSCSGPTDTSCSAPNQYCIWCPGIYAYHCYNSQLNTSPPTSGGSSSGSSSGSGSGTASPIGTSAPEALPSPSLKPVATAVTAF